MLVSLATAHHPVTPLHVARAVTAGAIIALAIHQRGRSYDTWYLNRTPWRKTRVVVEGALGGILLGLLLVPVRYWNAPTTDGTDIAVVLVMLAVLGSVLTFTCYIGPRGETGRPSE